MNKLIKLTATLFVLGLSGAAFADGITLTPADCDTTMPGGNCWTIVNDSSNPTDEEINTLVGATDLETLYKADVEDPIEESGDFAGDYETEFTNSSLDPENAWISWLGPEAIDCSDGCYLVVKDGISNPSVYIFDISDWNGIDHIHLEGFWPECTREEREAETCTNGAISHVAILGGESINRVPEPGTLALFGIGLFGIGIMRRRRVSR